MLRHTQVQTYESLLIIVSRMRGVSGRRCTCNNLISQTRYNPNARRHSTPETLGQTETPRDSVVEARALETNILATNTWSLPNVA